MEQGRNVARQLVHRNTPCTCDIFFFQHHSGTSVPSHILPPLVYTSISHPNGPGLSPNTTSLKMSPLPMQVTLSG